MSGNEEFIREFLEECAENLDRLDQDFVALESDPRDPKRLASVFRTLHTIKGTSGFFGFSKLGTVAHAGEHLLGKLRDGTLVLNAEITTALLQSVDNIRQILASIADTGQEGSATYDPIIDSLGKLAEGKSGFFRPALSIAPRTSPTEPERKATVSVPPADSLPPQPIPATPVLSASIAPESKVELDGSTMVEDAVGQTAGSEGSIRVDVGLLNKLMDLVGELVIGRNQLLQVTSREENLPLVNVSQRLDLITSELQEGIMKTRMQPIGNLWGKLPRVVRDLAHACSKEVNLVLEGRDTELDRSLLEAIKDPLTHLVRNSIDHGIELPAAREQAGKPRVGTLQLRAFHEGGQVNLDIADDGRGLDVARIRAKAAARGLIDPADLTLSDQDLVRLIFRPGFSTAESVSALSGRGVGMDVVRTNIEAIGGTIDLQNRPGMGLTVRIKIPLTLAIIPALIVMSGGERYAIPQISLIELLCFRGDAARSVVERIHNAAVYRLRGKLLPLLFLSEQLQQKSLADEDRLCVAVVQADGRHFGVVVDEIHNAEEIVVKPLDRVLKGIGAFSGATIMGDGRVALILDVTGLARNAGMSFEDSGTWTRARDADQPAAPAEDNLLLCQVEGARRVAVPLAAVDRLEDLRCENVEFAGGRPVIQYRGKLLPLVHASGQPFHPGTRGEQAIVIVLNRPDEQVGVVVDRVLDIVEFAGNRAESIVVDGRVTDLVDLQTLVEAVGANG